MRIVSGAVALALFIGVGCASRTDTTTTSGGSAPTPAATGGGAQAGGATGGGAAAGGAAGGGAATGARAGGAAGAGGAATGARAGGAAGAGAQTAARVTPEQLDAAMKTISTANGALGTKLMANDLPGAAKDAQTLATAFAEVERFFQQANKTDAVMWAQQARTGASEAATAAAAGDAMKTTAARGNMTATCKQCHGVYREGDAQTGYRVKAGTI